MTRDYRDIRLWKNAKPEEWTDWHWQLRQSVNTIAELEQVINLTDEEREGVTAASRFLKMKISPHICTMLDPNDPMDPLRRQFIPSVREVHSIDDPDLFADVNADDRYSPVYGLVHRYPTKVLIFPTNYCGSYCRYCFRRKLVREVEEALTRSQIDSCIKYIRANPKIEEVILSGGDPLVLGDEMLEYILDSLSQIKHVKMMRIHTRLPVTVPYRVTDKLISILTRHKPIFVVIHVDTAREISTPTRDAVAALVDNGIPCFASCPLLKGVNDNEEMLRSLWTELLVIRVKPYYLFHSDPVKGLLHFLVPMKRGIEIVRNLYDSMSGLAMPLYCFNVPDGGGHVILAPNYVNMLSDGQYEITTFEGQKIRYQEHQEYQNVKRVNKG